MALDLLQTFRILAAFEPERKSLADAPWEEYVEWCIAQGLAPLASYNLEFKLAGADAPEWARDRLLSVYQGWLNDNVMKFVSFRKAVYELEGCRAVLLDGAAFVEALYPHLAFRPVLRIDLLAKEEEIETIARHLSSGDFRSIAPGEDSGATARLSDGRTEILLYAALWEGMPASELKNLFDRAQPARVYGPSIFRLSLEDAALSVCIHQALEGYEVPYLSFVDLRELLLGAPSGAPPYSRPCNFAWLKETATRWGKARTLYASASIVGRLFPQVARAAHEATPALGLATKTLLGQLVVGPLVDIGKKRPLNVNSAIRRALAGT